MMDNANRPMMRDGSLITPNDRKGFEFSALPNATAELIAIAEGAATGLHSPALTPCWPLDLFHSFQGMESCCRRL